MSWDCQKRQKSLSCAKITVNTMQSYIIPDAEMLLRLIDWFTANRCAPVPAVRNAVPDSYLAVHGSVVRYTCIDGFFLSSPSAAHSTMCNGIRWTPAEPTSCEGTTHSLLYVCDILRMVSQADLTICTALILLYYNTSCCGQLGPL